MGGNVRGFFFSQKERNHKLEKKESEKKESEKKESEKKESEKKEEENQELVKKLSEDVVWFKRMMAHNIRMPLAIISGYGELLLNNSFSNRQEELECIHKICMNIEYLDTLTKVLLDDGSEDSLEQMEYFDILESINRVVGYVKTITSKAGIGIVVNSSKRSVNFYGNRISFMRVLFNLVENSIRYMNRQGNITITVEEMEKEILIVYRDDGEGMNPEEAKHITEFSFQGSNKKKSGHGMGMYLLGQTVEKYGGSLEVKTSEGNGMGIYMTFPNNRQKNL